MRKKRTMQRPQRQLGMSIGDSPLRPSAVRDFQSRGIYTWSQLYSLLRASGRARDRMQRMGLEGFGKGSQSVDAVGALLPDPVRTALDNVSFRMPTLTGLAGPSSKSELIRRRRSRTLSARKKVAAKIRILVRDNALPTKVLLTKWMTPVGDQGRLPSCTGWGSTTNREFLSQKELAPLFAYALAKHLDGRPDLEGSWQHFCFQGFFEIGHLRERDYPYTDRSPDLVVKPFRKRAKEFATDGFADLLLDAEDMDLQPALLKGILSGRLNDDMGPQPVSTSLAVYESWNSPSTALYGLLTVPFDWENLLGGHAMCIVGYIDADDDDGLYGVDYFVVKNSWGTGWAAENPLGLPGYALIPAAYFKKTRLHWESLVCLAERSPARSRGVLASLIATWNPGQLAPVPAGSYSR